MARKKENIIEELEIIEDKLKKIDITLRILNNYADIITPLSLDDLKNSNADSETLMNFWGKTKDGFEFHNCITDFLFTAQQDIEKILYHHLDYIKLRGAECDL